MPLEWGSRHHARLDAWNRGMAEGIAWLDTHTGLKDQTNREFVHPIYWKVIAVLFLRDLSSYNIYMNIHTFKQQSSILGKHLSYGPVAQRTPDHLPPGAQTTSRIEHTLRSPMHVFCHCWSDLYISYACHIPTSNENINMLLYTPDSFQQKIPSQVPCKPSLSMCV